MSVLRHTVRSLVDGGSHRYSDRRVRRQVRFVNIGSIIGLVLCAGWAINSLVIEAYVMAEANAVAGAAILPLFYVTRRVDPFLSAWGLNLVFHGLIVTFAFVLLGPETNVHYWFLVLAMVPILLFPLGRWPHMLVSAVVSMGLFYIAHFKMVDISPLYSFPQDLIKNQHVNLATVLVGMVLYLGLFVRDLYKAETALEQEHQRAERLLLNILPEPIARRLQEHEGTIAEAYDNATVLFCDIVGFTQLSRTISAEQVVDLLNAVFSGFDDLADYYGVEKIKTIGDAYMAVAGVPQVRPDHAAVVARLALDIRDYVNDFSESSALPMEIRIGINSGPVVAGVIGKKKFIYDLWGDAVNIAARMEAHGLPGAIQVSQATRDLLADQFDFEPRGNIDIKGVGQLPAFILTGERPD